MQRPAFCGQCGTPLRPGARFCVACGAEQVPAVQTAPSVAPPPVAPTPIAPVAPSAPPAVVPATTALGPPAAPALARYPLFYATPYPGRQSRLSTFFRALLALPHLIVLYVLGIAAWVAAVVAWFAILFIGRYPRSLWEFVFGYLRWYANLLTYLALLRDEYPPWGEGWSPVAFRLAYPERSNRLTVFVRLLLVLPAAFVLGLVQYAWLVTLVLAWFAILISGRHPMGLWRFNQGVARWTLRVQAYTLLLTDAYPPFALGSEETPLPPP